MRQEPGVTFCLINHRIGIRQLTTGLAVVIWLLSLFSIQAACAQSINLQYRLTGKQQVLLQLVINSDQTITPAIRLDFQSSFPVSIRDNPVLMARFTRDDKSGTSLQRLRFQSEAIANARLILAEGEHQLTTGFITARKILVLEDLSPSGMLGNTKALHYADMLFIAAKNNAAFPSPDDVGRHGKSHLDRELIRINTLISRIGKLLEPVEHRLQKNAPLELAQIIPLPHARPKVISISVQPPAGSLLFELTPGQNQLLAGILKPGRGELNRSVHGRFWQNIPKITQSTIRNSAKSLDALQFHGRVRLHNFQYLIWQSASKNLEADRFVTLQKLAHARNILTGHKPVSQTGMSKAELAASIEIYNALPLSVYLKLPWYSKKGQTSTSAKSIQKNLAGYIAAENRLLALAIPPVSGEKIAGSLNDDTFSNDDLLSKLKIDNIANYSQTTKASKTPDDRDIYVVELADKAENGASNSIRFEKQLWAEREPGEFKRAFSVPSVISLQYGVNYLLDRNIVPDDTRRERWHTKSTFLFDGTRIENKQTHHVSLRVVPLPDQKAVLYIYAGSDRSQSRADTAREALENGIRILDGE